jgi:hypothetical protein
VAGEVSEYSESARVERQHLLRLASGPCANADAEVITILGHGLLLSRRAVARFQDQQGQTWHTTLGSYYGPIGYVVRVRYLISDPSCNEPQTNHPRSTIVLGLKIGLILASLALAVVVGWLSSG